MQRNKFNQEFEKSKVEDLKNEQVPPCLYWTCEEVCQLFDSLGLPQYKETLMFNRVDGRKLIYLDASHLPNLGIQDFKHIKMITQKVRELLGLNDPYWNRSIAEIPRDILELYLEAKSFSGAKSDRLTYADFTTQTSDAKWQPPLTNQACLLPRF